MTKDEPNLPLLISLNDLNRYLFLEFANAEIVSKKENIGKLVGLKLPKISLYVNEKLLILEKDPKDNDYWDNFSSSCIISLKPLSLCFNPT